MTVTKADIVINIKKVRRLHDLILCDANNPGNKLFLLFSLVTNLTEDLLVSWTSAEVDIISKSTSGKGMDNYVQDSDIFSSTKPDFLTQTWIFTYRGGDR